MSQDLPDPTAYTAIASAGAPAFSRDGRTLFHLRGTGLREVWALPLDDGGGGQLTRHDQRVALLRRAPGDDRLVHGMDAHGDERQQLWLLDGPDARPLTDDPAVIHGFGAWHPDGARISVTANDRDAAHFDVLVLTVADGIRTRLWHGTHEVAVGGWHLSGDRLVATMDVSSGEQRPVVIGLDGTARPVPQARPARHASLRWDGDALMGLTDAHGQDFMALCRIDPATGDAAPVFAPPGRDVEAWALAPGGGLLATVENDRGYAVLRIGPPDGERPAVALPPGVVQDLAWSPDGTTLAFAASGHVRPMGLWLWRDGRAWPVWEPACDLPVADFRLVAWDGLDGRRIAGWLALPATPAPAGGHPAVVWVHGGPAAQTRATFRADMQSLLSQGYAVLMPNVRGSTGYGRAAMESDDREHRLDAVHDLACGARWLAAQPGIDAGRMAVMGQSYGGWMVLAAIAEYPELWRAAVCLYGIADFGTLLAVTGPWRRAHRAHEYGDPVRDHALFDRISPLRQVDRIRTPLQMFHGDRDPRVGIGESVQLHAALGARRRPVAFQQFPLAGHGFVRPDHRFALFQAVASFLERHLKQQP